MTQEEQNTMGYIDDYKGDCEGCFSECPLGDGYKSCPIWKDCKEDEENYYKR